MMFIDSAAKFVKEVEEENVVNQLCYDVYGNYVAWCMKNDTYVHKLTGLTKQLRKQRGIIVKRKRINGKLCGIYVKEWED